VIPILITSGKGGVGKTTIAINLAVNLAGRKIRVSLMDADLMAPNAHLFLNVNKERLREAGKMLMPLKVDEYLEFMGLGVFIPHGVGVALNYEKTTDFITTLLKFVKWTGDYLIVDCPPGSIDVNVKLFKELRGRARAIVVGEPHLFAIEDNLRIMDLLRFFDIEVRALVLNKYNLFSEGVAKEVIAGYEAQASKYGYRIVKIPWDAQLQTQTAPELFDELAEVVIV